MTATYTEFVDCTGAEFNNAPLVAGTVRAIYVTGYNGVPETQAQIDAARAAGVGLILIDQTPGLALFAAGKADVGDIEYLAGTDESAGSAVAKRQALGLTEHGLYASEDALPPLEADIVNPAGVVYWVANYSWSLTDAQAKLAANPTWRACQFGDPASNPHTLVPGTQITLQMAQFDIDVADWSWLSQFLPAAPTPTPTPVPAPPPPTHLVAPPFPFARYDYIGTPRPDPHCHSGYYGFLDHRAVLVWQQRMKDRGWTITVDGQYGINERTLNQGQSPTVCHQFQQEFGLSDDYLVGPETWAAAWTKPVS